MSNSYDSYVGYFQWINHQEKEILSLEFHGGYESDALHRLGLFAQELSARGECSVLLLAKLGNVSYSPKLALEWQKHQGLFHSRCAKIVILEATGIISIAVDTFLKVARASGLEVGQRIRHFEELDTAKDWLVGESEATPFPLSS